MSESLVLKCRDGNEYYVKFTNNQTGPTALVAELVGYRLARGLGLPVPECDLVDVPAGFWDPEDGTAEKITINGQPPATGVQFGSKALGRSMDSVVAQSYLQQKADTGFPLADCIAFDLWTGNEDRCANPGNFLICVGPDRATSFHMIDHGHLFFGPGWTAKDLNERKVSTNHPWGPIYDHFSRHVKGYAPFEGILRKIEGYSAADLVSAVSDIPESWGLEKETADALVSFLAFRRAMVRDIIMSNRNHYREWVRPDENLPNGNKLGAI